MNKFEQRIPGKDALRELNIDILAMAGVVAATNYLDEPKCEELKANISKVVVEDLKVHRLLNDDGVKWLVTSYRPITSKSTKKNIQEAVYAHGQIDETSKELINAVMTALPDNYVKNFTGIGLDVLAGRINLAVIDAMVAGDTIRTRSVLDKVGLEMWNIYMDHKPAANLEELATLKATASEEDILILEDMLAE